MGAAAHLWSANVAHQPRAHLGALRQMELQSLQQVHGGPQALQVTKGHIAAPGCFVGGWQQQHARRVSRRVGHFLQQVHLLGRQRGKPAQGMASVGVGGWGMRAQFTRVGTRGWGA